MKKGLRAMESSSAKLLVVDDIEDWQKTISGVLRDKGYNVVMAGSIIDATKLLEENKYDLALLDLRLDETDEDNIDGLKLAEIIRDRWPQVKIVIFTGYGTPEILQKAMRPDSKGRKLVEDYLPKDNSDKLIETVQRVLGK